MLVIELLRGAAGLGEFAVLSKRRMGCFNHFRSLQACRFPQRKISLVSRRDGVVVVDAQGKALRACWRLGRDGLG